MPKKIQTPLHSLHKIQNEKDKKKWKRKRRIDYYWPQFAHIEIIKTTLKTVDK